MRWISLACAFACALLMTGAPVAAQHASGSYSPGGPSAPEQACVTWSGGAIGSGSLLPCSAGGRQEAFQLVTANTASAAVTVYGGDYIFAQTCSAYGTLALKVLGPDGATQQIMISKTSTDNAGGTGLALGSNASVQVTLTGTTGCSASLTRVP